MTEYSTALVKYSQKLKGKPYNESIIFLESEPDFYIVLGDKIYPTHLSLMSQSNFICKQAKLKTHSLILKLDIENQIFQFVLGFIYDRNSLFAIRRDITAVYLIKAAHELQFPTLVLFIEDDVKKNFSLYNIFVLYVLCEELKMSQLADKCNENLINNNFKQIKDQRTQLLKLSRAFFIKILKNHQKLKKSRLIKGLTQQEILQIVKQYCQQDKNKNLKSQILFEIDQDLGQESLPESITSQSIGSSKSSKRPQKLKLSKKISQQQKKKDMSLRDSILELDQVKSPLVTLDELEERAQISWNKWANQQDNRFMSIEKDDFGQISQKDSQEEQDCTTVESSKKVLSRQDTLLVPQIHKHFSL